MKSRKILSAKTIAVTAVSQGRGINIHAGAKQNFLRNRFYILAIVLAVFGCISANVYSQTQNERREMPLPSLRFPAGKNVVEVPFEVEGGWMVIPVSVNGSSPLRYVLDTGASGAVHQNPAIVDSLNLKITGKMRVRGAGGGGATSEVSVAENVNFNIGGIELSNGNLAIRPSRSGHDGVIGRPIFANLVVEIDWEKKVVRFYEAARYKYSGSGTVLPLTFDEGGRPYTMASAVAGEKTIPVKLVVDTGGRHALQLDVGSNSEIKLPEGATKTVLGRGASGEITGYIGRTKALELGGQTFKDVPTIFPDSSSGTAGINGRQGNLGSGILRRFKVIYDYSRKQMIVEPNKFSRDPFGTVMPRTVASSAPVAPATLPDYAGKYGNKEISVKDGGLYYQRIGGSGAALRATGKDKFALNTDAQITFVRDANGVVTEMIIEWVERDKEQLKRETPARTQIQTLTPSLDIPMAVASKSGSQASGAPQKSNFSGVWLLDKDKSDGLPASVDQTVTIVQEGDRVEVATKTTSERGEQHSKSSYVLDGKEIETALSVPGSTVKGKQTSKWSPDGKGFESADEGTFETPNGPAIIKTSRKFQLSPDGTTLVIEISREGPMTQKSKRVFAKSGGAQAIRQAGHRKSEAEIVKEIETYLEQAVAEDTFSGGALIAKHGKPIFEKAYGLANKSSKTPNNVDTKFNLGSINKSFTSVAIAQLAQQGKLSFTDPINKYLPDYPNKAIANKVTIHQLLTHTSGMGMYFNDEFMKRRARLKTLADFLPLFVNDTLDFEPGEKMQYSNSGYVVLGLIIEKLTKQDYFDYVREHIFKPAGMMNTDSYKLEQKVPNLAIGYTNMGLTGRPELGARKDSRSHLTGRGNSAGGGYSTLDDMVKFGQALIDHKLLNKKYTDIVLSNQMSAGQPSAGYGFFSVQVNGTQAIGNNGGGPGTNSTFSVYPELGYTVVVMSNYDPPSASKVNSKLRDLLTSLPAAPQASSAPQPGQGQSLTEAEQEVRKLEREWLDAYEQHDVEAMNRILADEFKLTRSNGVQTKADILAELKTAPNSSRPPMKFSTEDVQSRVEGVTVILTGRFILRSERDGQTRTMMEARYTDTYVKRNGRWQVVASQMTRIPQK